MALERLDVNFCGDRFAAMLHRNIYDFVLSRLSPGQRILEIGTGLGAFTEELLPRGERYTGVEYDPETCLEACRQTEGRATIVRADAKALPFFDKQFSFVVCLEVLEHLGDFRAGVRSIHRCIEPGGKVIISVPYRKTGGPSDLNKYHVYEPGEAELVSTFESYFNKVEVHYQYFEETTGMTLARNLHLRRVLGMDRIYGDLTSGEPHALSRLHIHPKAKGMKLGLILVASGRKELTATAATKNANGSRSQQHA